MKYIVMKYFQIVLFLTAQMFKISENCLHLIIILYCLTEAYFAFPTSQEVVSEIENFSYNISFNETNNSIDEAAFDRIYLINQRAHIAENLYDGDMKFSEFRNALGRKWSKSKNGLVYIPYKFSVWYSKDEKSVIKRAMAEFRKRTCIRFIPRRSQKDYIAIWNLGGCWSFVGKRSSKQLLSLSKLDCIEHGITQHELMHALGFDHEHSRSDRDSYIRVPAENLKAGNHNLEKNFWTNNLVIYDYGSVMHYGSTAFAKRSYLRSIEIYPPRNPEPSFGKQARMSAYDIEEIKYYYGCGLKTYPRCGRDFKNNGSGSFKSPRHPKQYPNDAHCTWNITARPEKYIKLTITNIDISMFEREMGSSSSNGNLDDGLNTKLFILPYNQRNSFFYGPSAKIYGSTLCENDALIVHNGINANASVEKRICGKKSKIVITSRWRSLFVIFTSGNYAAGKGFTASFAEVTTRGKPPPPIPTLPPVPIKKNLIKSFRCNFDAGICGMKQDKTDKENYNLRRGNNSNYNSGPSGDHTSRRGKYLYFDGKAKSSNNAIIRTPWLKRQNKLCIQFSYHMYGFSMGALRVYAFEKRKNINHGKRKVLWEKLGNQKNKWNDARIIYTPHYFAEQMQFYWEAISSGLASNIAIDDVVVTPSRRC